MLDGLEPLQQVGRGMRGELKDRAIRKMLRCLVGDHSSLCIITTRLPVHELKGRRRVAQHDLQNLAPEDGVALLRSFTEPYPVHGRNVDMVAAVEEYGRHALALHLLGNALATYLDGDVRKRDTLSELIGDYDDVEQHAFKVMQAYERWLEGTVELKLLYLLGLFDHPVEQEVLEVLWEAVIPGLTEGVEKKAWLVARRDLLGKFRMMSEHEGRDDLFDCHPLIREYFGQQLKESEGEVWRKAHTVLYEYYKELPEKLWGKFLPDTLEEIKEFSPVIIHGCKAGLYAETFALYMHRFCRENDNYLCTKLGAFEYDLSILASFFITPWDEPVLGVPQGVTVTLLHFSSFRLQSVGRTTESLKPAISSVKLLEQIDQKSNEGLAKSYHHISGIFFDMGDIEKALQISVTSFKHAQASKSLFMYAASAAMAGDCYFQAGKYDLSKLAFEDAEKVQKILTPETPFLHSIAGFRYCKLLLKNENFLELRRRCTVVLEKDVLENGNNKLNQMSIGLTLLSIASSHLVEKNYNLAKGFANQALDELRLYNSQQHLVLGLFCLASINRSTSQNFGGYYQLQEIYEIAEPSGMRLHLTDYHLEMARLILSIETDPTQYPEATSDRKQRILPPEIADPDEPGILTLQGHIQAADKLIQDTGYHRRDAELTELKQQAGMSC